nr:immunoglobulin heavy chain junction region [Mus musculus]
CARTFYYDYAFDYW